MNWRPAKPPVSTRFARAAAVKLLGDGHVVDIEKPYLGSEDFSFMLGQVPGSYLMMGNGEDCAALHNPTYNFNDDAIAPGAAYWTALTESFLTSA
jgi:hippurate hydrolase